MDPLDVRIIVITGINLRGYLRFILGITSKPETLNPQRVRQGRRWAAKTLNPWFKACLR